MDLDLALLPLGTNFKICEVTYLELFDNKNTVIHRQLQSRKNLNVAVSPELKSKLEANNSKLELPAPIVTGKLDLTDPANQDKVTELIVSTRIETYKQVLKDYSIPFKLVLKSNSMADLATNLKIGYSTLYKRFKDITRKLFPNDKVSPYSLLVILKDELSND